MPNYIKLFAPVKNPLTENHPVRNGIITISEPLSAGDYQFGLFEKVSKKGNNYLSGIILPAYKKEVKPFSEPKEPESKLNEDLGEDIPW